MYLIGIMKQLQEVSNKLPDSIYNANIPFHGTHLAEIKIFDKN